MESPPDPSDAPMRIDYATPAKRDRGSTREVIFAAITLALGVGFLLAALPLGLLAIAAFLDPSALVAAPILLVAMAIAGVGGWTVARSSWWTIRAGGVASERERMDREEITAGGCAIMMLAVPALMVSVLMIGVGFIFFVKTLVDAKGEGVLVSGAVVVIGTGSATCCILLLRLRQ
jgi:hypothetical protein